MQKDQSYAAIDLGSNSFHMIVAEPEGSSIRMIDSLRVSTRLGAGLDQQKNLTPETLERALEAMALFAERLEEVPTRNIRAVGTNTLRRARNAQEFMRVSEELIGVPIEIISGREEARLIYLAVAHALPEPDRTRLIIDIGGGSTELVIGTGLEPRLMESVNMGCVSYSQRFIDEAGSNEKSLERALKRATVEAELELQPLVRAYQDSGWDEAIGCSGTIKAAGKMLAEVGLTDGTVTRDGLKRLLKQITRAGGVGAMNFESISSSRSQVITGGLAVLYGVMRALSINRVRPSTLALREGVIFGMIGQKEHIDVQSETLANLASRFSIDIAQAERVEDTSRKLFAKVADAWQLDEQRHLDLLVWAAKLHELGMGVAHTQYHKHGAYILENSDLLGFTRAEQTALALLVRYHRRKIDAEAFDGLPDHVRERLQRLLSLLRLAALLHRSRLPSSLDELDVDVSEGRITVLAPKEWLDAHPLTHAELESETDRLLRVDIRLKPLR